MLYFTDVSRSGWVRFHQLRGRVGVMDRPSTHVLIGSASEVGLTQDGYALWSLRVNNADIPGRCVIVDGMFMAATADPSPGRFGPDLFANVSGDSWPQATRGGIGHASRSSPGEYRRQRLANAILRSLAGREGPMKRQA
jgi:hypothetical protein